MLTMKHTLCAPLGLAVVIVLCAWASSCATSSHVDAVSSSSPQALLWSSDARRIALLDPEVTITTGFRNAEDVEATGTARDNIRGAFESVLRSRGVDVVSVDAATARQQVPEIDGLIATYWQNAGRLLKASSHAPLVAVVALVEVRSGHVVWAAGATAAPNPRAMIAVNGVARRLLESAPLAASTNLASAASVASEPPSAPREAASSNREDVTMPPETAQQPPDASALVEEATSNIVADAREQSVWALAPSAAQLGERFDTDFVLIVRWPNHHVRSADERAADATAALMCVLLAACPPF